MDLHPDLRRTARDVVDGFAEHKLLTYASAIAYQVISSVIPLAMFALALLGALNAESLWTDHLKPDVFDSVSLSVFTVIDETVTQILSRKQTFWVSFGLVLVLWELGGALRATMEALDDVYAIDRERSRTSKYVTSTLLAAAVGVVWLLSIALIVGGHALLPGILGGFGRYLIAAALLMLAVWLTLRFGPAERLPVGWVSAGSVVIVVGWVIVVGGYVYYATNIASYASVFGALAAAFVLIVVAYMSAVVFLTGVLIDAKARDES